MRNPSLNNLLRQCTSKQDFDKVYSYLEDSSNIPSVNGITFQALKEILKNEVKKRDANVFPTIHFILDVITTIYTHEKIPLIDLEKFSEACASFIDSTVETVLSLLSKYQKEELSSLFTRTLKVFCIVSEKSTRTRNDVVKFASGSVLKMCLVREFGFEFCKTSLKRLNEVLQWSRKDFRLSVGAEHDAELNKLVDMIYDCGDYDLQVTITETLFRYISKENRPNAAKHWFRSKPHLCSLFANIKDFEPDCRKFLNALNSSFGDRRLVWSYPCVAAFLGALEIKKPPDPLYPEFWIDFNFGNGTLLIYFDPTSVCTGSSSQGNDVWEMVSIDRESVIGVTLLETVFRGQRLKELCVYLSQPCHIFVSATQSTEIPENVVNILFELHIPLKQVLKKMYPLLYEKVPNGSVSSQSDNIQIVPHSNLNVQKTPTAQRDINIQETSAPQPNIRVQKASMGETSTYVQATSVPQLNANIQKASVAHSNVDLQKESEPTNFLRVLQNRINLSHNVAAAQNVDLNPKAPDTARKKEEWDRLQKASAMFADVCARPGGSNNPISVSSSSCKGPKKSGKASTGLIDCHMSEMKIRKRYGKLNISVKSPKPKDKLTSDLLTDDDIEEHPIQEAPNTSKDKNKAETGSNAAVREEEIVTTNSSRLRVDAQQDEELNSEASKQLEIMKKRRKFCEDILNKKLSMLSARDLSLVPVAEERPSNTLSADEQSSKADRSKSNILCKMAATKDSFHQDVSVSNKSEKEKLETNFNKAGLVTSTELSQQCVEQTKKYVASNTDTPYCAETETNASIGDTISTKDKTIALKDSDITNENRETVSVNKMSGRRKQITEEKRQNLLQEWESDASEKGSNEIVESSLKRHEKVAVEQNNLKHLNNSTAKFFRHKHDKLNKMKEVQSNQSVNLATPLKGTTPTPRKRKLFSISKNQDIIQVQSSQETSQETGNNPAYLGNPTHASKKETVNNVEKSDTEKVDFHVTKNDDKEKDYISYSFPQLDACDINKIKERKKNSRKGGLDRKCKEKEISKKEVIQVSDEEDQPVSRSTKEKKRNAKETNKSEDVHDVSNKENDKNVKKTSISEAFHHVSVYSEIESDEKSERSWLRGVGKKCKPKRTYGGVKLNTGNKRQSRSRGRKPNKGKGEDQGYSDRTTSLFVDSDDSSEYDPVFGSLKPRRNPYPKRRRKRVSDVHENSALSETLSRFSMNGVANDSYQSYVNRIKKKHFGTPKGRTYSNEYDLTDESDFEPKQNRQNSKNQSMSSRNRKPNLLSKKSGDRKEKSDIEEVGSMVSSLPELVIEKIKHTSSATWNRVVSPSTVSSRSSVNNKKNMLRDTNVGEDSLEDANLHEEIAEKASRMKQQQARQSEAVTNPSDAGEVDETLECDHNDSNDPEVADDSDAEVEVSRKGSTCSKISLKRKSEIEKISNKLQRDLPTKKEFSRRQTDLLKTKKVVNNNSPDTFHSGNNSGKEMYVKQRKIGKKGMSCVTNNDSVHRNKNNTRKNVVEVKTNPLRKKKLSIHTSSNDDSDQMNQSDTEDEKTIPEKRERSLKKTKLLDQDRSNENSDASNCSDTESRRKGPGNQAELQGKKKLPTRSEPVEDNYEFHDSDEEPETTVSRRQTKSKVNKKLFIQNELVNDNRSDTTVKRKITNKQNKRLRRQKMLDKNVDEDDDNDELDHRNKENETVIADKQMKTLRRKKLPITSKCVEEDKEASRSDTRLVEDLSKKHTKPVGKQKLTCADLTSADVLIVDDDDSDKSNSDVEMEEDLGEEQAGLLEINLSDSEDNEFNCNTAQSEVNAKRSKPLNRKEHPAEVSIDEGGNNFNTDTNRRKEKTGREPKLSKKKKKEVPVKDSSDDTDYALSKRNIRKGTQKQVVRRSELTITNENESDDNECLENIPETQSAEASENSSDNDAAADEIPELRSEAIDLASDHLDMAAEWGNTDSPPPSENIQRNEDLLLTANNFSERTGIEVPFTLPSSSMAPLTVKAPSKTSTRTSTMNFPSPVSSRTVTTSLKSVRALSGIESISLEGECDEELQIDNHDEDNNQLIGNCAASSGIQVQTTVDVHIPTDECTKQTIGSGRDRSESGVEEQVERCSYQQMMKSGKRVMYIENELEKSVKSKRKKNKNDLLPSSSFETERRGKWQSKIFHETEEDFSIESHFVNFEIKSSAATSNKERLKEYFTLKHQYLSKFGADILKVLEEDMYEKGAMFSVKHNEVVEQYRRDIEKEMELAESQLRKSEEMENRLKKCLKYLQNIHESASESNKIQAESISRIKSINTNFTENLTSVQSEQEAVINAHEQLKLQLRELRRKHLLEQQKMQLQKFKDVFCSYYM